MAATHHKFLFNPTTNEAFSWRVVETKTNQIISQHRNLRLALDKAERLSVEAAAAAPLGRVREEVPRCGYQDEGYPYPCSAPATVTDIETGCTFCATHFREVIL